MGCVQFMCARIGMVTGRGLAGTLRTAFAKGPALREEENLTTLSNRPRNDAFVYLVAGTLLSVGVPVIAVDGKVVRNETCKSKTDATFRWEDLLINVECKRPQSQKALGKLTKEARGQIENPSRGGRHGVIALDCSVVIRPKWNLLGCDSEEAAKQSERSISMWLEKSILPQIKMHLNESILGFILFAKVPAKIQVHTSPVVTALGEPIHEFRLDCISTWLVAGNEQHPQHQILRHAAGRLEQQQARSNKPDSQS
jgi:hypothetical protein